MLPQCPHLSVLDLVVNHIGANGAGRFAGVLPQCPVLSELRIGGNQIRAEGAGIAGVLPQCARLSILHLYVNQTGADGAGRLAEVLPQCRTLSVLSLAYNQIGAEGAAKLAGVLPQCPKLTNLLLGANQMGAEGAARSRHSQSLSLLPPKPCLRGSFTFAPQTCNGLARKQGHGLHQRLFCITTHDARLRCTCCCMLKRRVIAPVQLHNVGLLLLSLAGLSDRLFRP